ncbi:hypothetical protein JCM14036_07430 [Desulfotomaculum defluvii]
MRYIRAMVALVVIILYISTAKFETNRLVKSIILLLFIHSTIIITEILFPPFREFMTPFSGVSRKFYEFRANGIVNSYDLAGIYSNLGLLLSALIYIQSRKKVYLLMSLISIIAVIFTSRLNMAVMLLVLLFILIKSIKMKVKVFTTLIFSIYIVSGVVGGVVWAITTDMFPTIRDFILQYNWGNSLYINIRATYSDDDITSVLAKHFNLNINSAQSFLFGLGTEGNLDPGFSKIYNSIGFLGLGSIVLYYLYQLFYIRKLKCVQFNTHEYVVYISLIFIMLVMLIGNLKILYFFSTSLFELVSILMIKYELTIWKLKKQRL